MGIQIDRAGRLIINMQGIAHFPGYLFRERNISCLDSSVYDLMKGKSYFKGGMYWIVQESDVIISCPKKELTIEKFMELTGWKPE
jgi:hypothetical protein